MKITAHYSINPQWIFTPEAQEDGRVWLFVRSGDMSGGLFMSPSQALALASELTNAAEHALDTKEKAA